MDGATIRLRNAFRYSTNNDSTDKLPEILYEEEQDHLIQSLIRENATWNMYYQMSLVAISLLLLIVYLPALFHRATALIALLAFTSLSSTAFLAYSLPPIATGIRIIDNAVVTKMATFKYVSGLRHDLWKPILSYLPYLNVVLSVLTSILGWMVRAKVGQEEIVWAGLEYLPGLWYAAVVLAKVIMRSVDPEQDLGALRYQLKGA